MSYFQTECFGFPQPVNSLFLFCLSELGKASMNCVNMHTFKLTHNWEASRDQVPDLKDFKLFLIVHIVMSSDCASSN